MALTPEERKELEEYYGSLLEMFKSKGWNYFVEDLSEARETLTVENIATLEDLHFARGKLDLIGRIENLSEQIAMLRDELNEDAA